VSWNFGDILDGVEAVLPSDAPALCHADRRVTWGEFSRLSNNLAASLVARGARPGDRIAFYLRNRPEYLVGVSAAFKARLVHTNVNYRYLDDELHYILDDADAKVVVFGDEFAERVGHLTDRLPKVEQWLQVGGAPTSAAGSFQALCEEGDGAPLPIERSPDDLLFVYTGGTTGMPKGVMWRHEDLWGALRGGESIPANGGVRPASVEAHVHNVGAYGPGPVQIPACPLMHGTGLFTAILNLLSGGCCVTLTSESFDAEELFDAISRHRVASIVIVGDAFARPMLKALDAQPGRWDLSSLRIALSSGVMWSQETKQGLLRHHPDMVLADMFGASEAVGFGASITSAKGGSRTAKFVIGDDCKVFTEDHREVAPGSGERGFIARRGPIPLGYHKDPEKTAATFPTIAGVRYSVPGDWCTVEADGTLTLLGRGSVCINTAGEKVYPEEVEEALKTHPDVEDALVVGVPDEKWGQAVTAVVEMSQGTDLDEGSLRRYVRQHLAGYKAPKRIVAVQSMFRAPNGKADYKGAASYARQQLGGA
jgi:fatty-acyl-CoA synthase